MALIQFMGPMKVYGSQQKFMGPIKNYIVKILIGGLHLYLSRFGRGGAAAHGFLYLVKNTFGLVKNTFEALDLNTRRRFKHFRGEN